jgi:CheY-like chemotaxis protein
VSNDLLSLRAVLVSPSAGDHDRFRQAASMLAVPVELATADDAAAALDCLADGADLVFICRRLAPKDVTKVIAAARAAAKPPFTVLLTEPGAASREPPPADGAAIKPADRDAAQQLLDRAIRIRLPSRVLLVDDSSTMRSIVRKILAATRFNFEIVEAQEGAAALKLARDSEFDIAFLDYNMPGFTGLETLAALKHGKMRMSVVVMTSTRDETLVERVRAQGAIYLKKPFFPADIEALLCGHYGLSALSPQRG